MRNKQSNMTLNFKSQNFSCFIDGDPMGDDMIVTLIWKFMTFFKKINCTNQT